MEKLIYIFLVEFLIVMLVSFIYQIAHDKERKKLLEDIKANMDEMEDLFNKSDK